MTAPGPLTGVVLMAYGTPRTTEEILPYYTDIRRGVPPSDEQLADLTRRYAAIGGTSPLTERTEAQRAALQSALDAAAPGAFCVVLGMKHTAPSIEAAVDALAARGVGRIVALVLAPHFSAFSVGQYLTRARTAAEAHGVELRAIESWATEPEFVAFLAGAVRDRLSTLPARTQVVFTAHSLPQRILATGDRYPDELRATAEAVAVAADLDDWSLGWQSAGRTADPWLGPDVLEVIDALAATGHHDGVLVSACGFVADHLEVLYDLDVMAAAHAADRGLAFARTACVNADPPVMTALAHRVMAVA